MMASKLVVETHFLCQEFSYKRALIWLGDLRYISYLNNKRDELLGPTKLWDKKVQQDICLKLELPRILPDLHRRLRRNSLRCSQASEKLLKSISKGNSPSLSPLLSSDQKRRQRPRSNRTTDFTRVENGNSLHFNSYFTPPLDNLEWTKRPLGT